MNITMRDVLRYAVIFVIVLGALGSRATAQFDTATVLGSVRDASDAVIPGAAVTLTNLEKGISVSRLTGEDGNFEFPGVSVGRYRIIAQKQGFDKAIVQDVAVTVNSRQRIDLKLPVASVGTEITVNAQPAVLETDSSDRGQVITSREIVNLPLNGRAYADLSLLVPGVRKSVLENQTTSNRDASFNVNGQRSALNNFLIDGLDNNAYGTSNQGFSNQVIQLTPDAVSEFKVQTDNYGAEYGRASGAVINVTTRSGGNQFHGAAWEYLRNTVLNAIGPFAPVGGVKPTLIQNQFGASVGGPILKNRTFFFADYEGFRRITTSLASATVPTADQRAGNFHTAAGAPIPIRNPITGQVFANGIVPSNLITPFAQSVLSALPLSNQPGNSNNFVSQPRAAINDDKGDIRLDQYFNQKLTAFFRFSERQAAIFDPPAIPGPAGGNANGNVKVFNQQIASGTTYTLTPKSLIDARIGFTWTEGGKSPIGLGQPSLLAGIPGVPTIDRLAGALNSQSVTGFSQFGRQTSNPQFQNPFVVNPKINYSLLRGRHSLKFGYEFQDIRTTISDFNPAYGLDQYSGQFSRSGTGSVSLEQQQAYNLTDFLFGARSHYELNNVAVVDYNQQLHSWYAQDDWKVNNKLSLNIGLRYELNVPQWVSDNRLANFDPATHSLIQAHGDSISGRSLVNMQTNNWAPRVGLAYNITPKTVVRSAYGISYVQFNRLGGENLLAYNGPNVVDATIDQTPSQGVCSAGQDPATCFRLTQQGYSPNFASPANFNPLRAQARYIPPDNPTGYVQNWHLTVQRELSPNMVLDVAYVGSHAVHLMILGDFNQANANLPSQNVSLQSRRPISNFSTIEVAFGGGYLDYHALQVKFERKFTKGLYLLNSFTWSKGIDNASGHLEAFNGDNSRVNIRDIASERGVSGYDQPFNDVLSLVYDLPYGKGRRWGSDAPALVKGILGGWQMSAINTASSGLPVTLTYSPSSAANVSGLPTYRPNIVGDPLNPSSAYVRTPFALTNFFNKSALQIPDPSQPFGNAGRNSMRAPNFTQLDLALHKQFSLAAENRSLEFRAEMFNLLNRTNFFAPDGNVSNATFGSITQAFPARQIQFALRFAF